MKSAVLRFSKLAPADSPERVSKQTLSEVPGPLLQGPKKVFGLGF
jgi:hypothetical protein